jgi:hypothetical protein
MSEASTTRRKVDYFRLPRFQVPCGGNSRRSALAQKEEEKAGRGGGGRDPGHPTASPHHNGIWYYVLF